MFKPRLPAFCCAALANQSLKVALDRSRSRDNMGLRGNKVARLPLLGMTYCSSETSEVSRNFHA